MLLIPRRPLRVGSELFEGCNPTVFLACVPHRLRTIEPDSDVIGRRLEGCPAVTYEDLFTEWIDPHCHEASCSNPDERGAKPGLPFYDDCPSTRAACCNDKYLTTFCMNKPCDEISDHFSGIVRCVYPSCPGFESCFVAWAPSLLSRACLLRGRRHNKVSESLACSGIRPTRSGEPKTDTGLLSGTWASTRSK